MQQQHMHFFTVFVDRMIVRAIPTAHRTISVRDRWPTTSARRNLLVFRGSQVIGTVAKCGMVVDLNSMISVYPQNLPFLLPRFDLLRYTTFELYDYMHLNY